MRLAQYSSVEKSGGKIVWVQDYIEANAVVIIRATPKVPVPNVTVTLTHSK